ncbi:MAG: restriction endonuclease subunit S [Geobacter sp.]|nr:restriction endonuclease subunit S [Geobacter sp.]
MSSEWKSVNIASLCTGIYDGPHATPKKIDHGPIFLGISSLNKGQLDLSSLEYLSEDDYSKWTKRVVPQKGDIVFSYETKLGEVAIIPDGLRCCLGRRMALMRIDQSKAIPEYILYAYLSPTFQKVIRERTIHGSTVDRIPLTEFGSFPISIPPLPVQKEIAETLKALDDRIALLRETNITLEAIAQALFKSWFVDFDPVRAKQEGREPEGMDADTAALFPDSFEESELGLVPKGWVQVPFTDTVNVIGGGTPKTSIPEYWNGNIPWFSVVDAPTITDIFVIDTQKHITEQGLNNSSTKLLAEGTTIISARGTVGRLALVGRQMAMNQSCYGLRGKSDDAYFTYFSTYRLVESLKQHSHGSVFDTITTQTMTGVFVIYPTKTVILAFETLLKPVMDRIKENLEQAQTLTTLRDTLLPRLISGQLRLPDAEALIEEAAA